MVILHSPKRTQKSNTMRRVTIEDARELAEAQAVVDAILAPEASCPSNPFSQLDAKLDKVLDFFKGMIVEVNKITSKMDGVTGDLAGLRQDMGQNFCKMQERVTALEEEQVSLRQLLEQQQKEVDELRRVVQRPVTFAAAAGAAAGAASEALPPPPPRPTESAEAVRAHPSTEEALLQMRVELPVAENESEEAAVKRVLELAGVRNAIDSAQFAGPRRGDRRAMVLKLRNAGQRAALYKNRGALRAAGAYVTIQRSPFQHRQYKQLQTNPAYKLAIDAALARRQAGQKVDIIPLPHGCIVDTTFWTLEYAQQMEQYNALLQRQQDRQPASSPQTAAAAPAPV